MEFSLVSLLQGSGLSLTDMADKFNNIIEFVPKAKEYLPKVKELEKLYPIKENQKMFFSVLPIIPDYTGTETPEELTEKNKLCEVKISVLVMEPDPTGRCLALIVDEPLSFLAFAEVEKITVLFPKM